MDYVRCHRGTCHLSQTVGVVTRCRDRLWMGDRYCYDTECMTHIV